MKQARYLKLRTARARLLEQARWEGYAIKGNTVIISGAGRVVFRFRGTVITIWHTDENRVEHLSGEFAESVSTANNQVKNTKAITEYLEAGGE